MIAHDANCDLDLRERDHAMSLNKAMGIYLVYAG
jgi:hypothetical protein